MNFLKATARKTCYAQIDLKRANIYARDGYDGATGAKVGAVNLMAGYASGVTTMTVDGFTAAVTNGDTFTVVGSQVTGRPLTRHTITAHTETMSATTSITFTPGLSAAVLDNAVITIVPHQLQVRLGEGTLTYSEKKPRTYVKDRGLLYGVRDADEEPVDVRMDAIWEFLKADTGMTPTIEDVLKQRGEASTWVTSGDDPCEPYSIDLVIEYIPNCTTESYEIITLEEFRYEEINHDPKAGTFSITGKANVTEASVVRG